MTAPRSRSQPADRTRPAEHGAARSRAGPLDELRRTRLRRLLCAALGAPWQEERLSRAGFGARRELERADPEEVLHRLEPVRKQDLRAAGVAALRGGRARPWWLSSLSSGSTGEPFRVYYSIRAWLLSKWWIKWRARRACGVRLADRIAILEVMPPELEGKTVLERLGRVCKLSLFSERSATDQRLAAFDPDVLYGLPSALLELEHLARCGRIHPRLVFASGELLTTGLRTRLAAAFGCPVLDVYGTSETKEIAWQCLAGGLHVNADVIWLEVLDDAGDPLPPGVEGELVATHLWNHAMPIVRYRTGDLGRLLPERCPCGHPSPLLGVLSGREVEVLELGAGRRLTPYAITTALEQVAGLQRYQVRQVARDRLQVRALLDADAAEAGERSAAIRRALGGIVVPPVEIEVLLVDRFEESLGKFRVVVPLGS